MNRVKLLELFKQKLIIFIGIILGISAAHLIVKKIIKKIRTFNKKTNKKKKKREGEINKEPIRKNKNNNNNI